MRLRRRSLPDATIARLPQYIRCLSQLENAGLQTVHSVDLAAHVGVSGAVVRRDLSYVGSYGTRGVGYPVTQLREQVNQALGLATEHRMVVVGVGHLGRALAGYTGFDRAGPSGRRAVRCRSRADRFEGRQPIGVSGDPDAGRTPLVRGRQWRGHRRDRHPAEAAQSVADLLVAAGVTSILNLSAVHLSTPDSVVVRPVDLATEIQILAVHAAHGAGR